MFTGLPASSALEVKHFVTAREISNPAEMAVLLNIVKLLIKVMVGT